MAVNMEKLDTVENSSDGEEDTRTEIRKELANMSFEEVQKLKEQLGAKVFNEAYHGKPLRDRPKSNAKLKSRRGCSQSSGKKGKHAPREESSKVRVPSVRDVVVVPKVVRRDPRFDGVSGTYDEKAWKRNYNFVGDIKSSEVAQLKEQLRKEVDPSEKKKMKLLLQRMQNQEKAEKLKEKKEAESKMEREENIARMQQGKKPIYKTKSFKKKEELAERFIELKESGKLDKYMQKKRKKLASKSKKQLMAP